LRTPARPRAMTTSTKEKASMGQPSRGQGSPGAVRPLPLADATATGAGAADADADADAEADPMAGGARKPPVGASGVGASAWVLGDRPARGGRGAGAYKGREGREAGRRRRRVGGWVGARGVACERVNLSLSPSFAPAPFPCGRPRRPCHPRTG